jgi:hypothetical protein
MSLRASVFRSGARSSSLLVLAILAASCQPTESTEPPSESSPESEVGSGGEDVGEARSSLSPAKVVPLRFVHLLSAASCTDAAPCDGNATTRSIRAAVDRANEVYEPAGIKLWIKSEERINAPNLSMISATPSFAAVRNELRAIHPNIPTDAYTDSETKNSRAWARAAATFYGSADEIVIHVWPPGSSNTSDGAFPETGRSIRLIGDHFTWRVISDSSLPRVPSTVLAHELGHYFGLRHTFENPWGTNPLTFTSWTVEDRWDEFYCQDTGQPFLAPGFVQLCDDPAPIDGGSNCTTVAAGSGQPRCTLPETGTTYLAGNFMMNGLFRLVPGATHAPPESYAYAANIMGYRDGPSSWALDEGAPAFVSETQMDIMDTYLQLPGWLDDEHIDLFRRLDNTLPDDVTMCALDNCRRLLGSDTDDFISYSNGDNHLNAKFSFATKPKPVSGTEYVPVSGDFDEDGHGDILWYKPTDTTARFWWGRADRGFDEENRSGFFPETGYTVFVGDFDGDDDSDLFLYKPGAGQDRIKRRTTFRNFTSHASDWLYTAVGTYVPIVGNFDGLHGDDIYWYSPSSSHVHRWFSTGTSAFDPYDFVLTPTSTYGMVPIVGDFDGNGADDVFWYLAGGTVTEKIWYGPQSGSNNLTSTTNNVTGTYEPVAGDFDGDGRTDILWDAKNSRNDSIWAGKAGGGFDRGGPFGDASVTHSGTVSFYGAFDAVVGDFDGDDSDDIMWYRE